MDNMIGARIKTKRKELHLTLTQIKDITGLSTGHLSALERGEKLPSTPTLIKLSDLFNCSIDWILQGNSSNSESLNRAISLNLTNQEMDLVQNFRHLTTDSQEEILDLIELKIARQKRKQRSHLSDLDQTSGIA